MRFSVLILSLIALFPAWSQTLVLPGDYPDPSVVRIGDTYWATATTSNWAPAFPLLESKDLIHWTLSGHVFPELPAWADYYFWAPEISFEDGKVYVYYSAHKKGGGLCVAVASADSPEGPYTDHGPLMCQPAGSIDAFPVRDSNGKLYMIWKEDGNSIKEPTPIWAMEMNEERTALIGQKTELFRNDTPWESNLVEGVSMIRHGPYIYAFYAGAGCCGRECSYAMGIARAKDLLGPWEKYEGNPQFESNSDWKCPGHGTPVEKDGRYYLLYHGYHSLDNVYTGRQGLLKEFTFTPEGWIALVEDDGGAPAPPIRIYDEFNDSELSSHWQWSVFQNPRYRVAKGMLELWTVPGVAGAFLAQKIYNGDYQASVTIYPRRSKAEAGLAVIGDEKNLIGITLLKDKLSVWKIQGNQKYLLEEKSLSIKNGIQLRAVAENGNKINFFYSVDGDDFQKLNANTVDGAYLPPWDRAIRVGVVAIGSKAAKAVFDDFVLEKH